MLLDTEKVYEPIVSDQVETTARFRQDVLKGLSCHHKKLDSKYFYDATGDRLFQKLMACEEYYVTRCEAEILQKYATEIAASLKEDYEDFDVIELGAGDASKTVFLLKELINLKCNFKYVPVDISPSIIQYLEKELPVKVPGLEIKGLAGEYLDMLNRASTTSKRKKVIIFLGSNIGNMDTANALNFLKAVRANLTTGDRVLIGFDLKKDPSTVLAAYNDAEGLTRAFNLNLLDRINRELDADFNTSKFEHYPTYDPISGACKSYLISKAEQQVIIAGKVFKFSKGEVIYMELSQKYDQQEIKNMAESSGFTTTKFFTDQLGWFVDTIWECI